MSNDCEFGGIIKLYEGLYIAQEFGARDIESIMMNHITHIINCTADHVPNFFQQQQINYLSFRFNQSNSEIIILDSYDRVISDVFSFVQETREQGESILIHGFKDYNLPLLFFAAYLMLKYRWALNKSLQFLQRRVGPLPIKGSLMNQLRSLQIRYKSKIRGELSTQWQINPNMSLQEQTVHNTYINALGLGKAKSPFYQFQKQQIKKKVTWKEATIRAASSKPKTRLKSILKGSFIQKQIRQKSQKSSTSQSLLKNKQKQMKPNSSLDNKSFKLIKDKIQDKLRTTITLFKPRQQQSKTRLKSQSGDEEDKRPLANVTNINKPPKPSSSYEQIPIKRSLHLKQRINTDENTQNSQVDITKKLIKSIIFQKNNQSLMRDTFSKIGERQRSKNNSDVGVRDSKLAKQPRYKPIVNNFMSQSKSYSKPQSPAQKPQKTITNTNSHFKVDLKLKTQSQFRGFSPMLKQAKKKDIDSILSTKIFSDGSKKAWK